MVPVTDRGEGADRSVAEALQHGAAAFEFGYLTPAAFAAKLETDAHATGRIAAVYGASAPRPVAQPSRKGQTKEAIGVVVSS